MNKIFIIAEESNALGPGYHCAALAEDGTGICGHYSSTIGFTKHDMGLTSDWKHEHYKKHYPGGYELIWVDDPDNHPGFLAALELNKQKSEKQEEVRRSLF